MKSNRLMNVSERWFKLLLRLYPPDFRDEMGEALVETYRDRLSGAFKRGVAFRTIHLAGVWCTALWDSLRNGLGERLRPAVSWRRSGDWGRDIELVSRRLRQKPLFFAAVLGTLTVGLGTFAVVYTAVDKILIEPLPYPDPHDLYTVWSRAKDLEHFMITGPEVTELQKAGGVIEVAAAFQTGTGTLSAGADKDAVVVDAVVSSANLFDLLGVRPVLGRGFRPDESGRGTPPVAVVSHKLWKRFGGDPAIIGTALKVSGTSYTVVGIMPPDFSFSSFPSQRPDVYVPFNAELATQNPKNSNYIGLIRARRGSSPEQVHLAVDAVGRFVDTRDNNGRGRTLYPIGLQADIVNAVRPALLALGFAGIFLVLVLTVNLASLLLARAAEREREFAVSRALGGSGSAVVRATVVEGGLLGLMGGISGVLAGIWGTRLLVALGPLNLPRRETIAVDWGVAAVVIGVGVLIGLIAAAAPAMWAARAPLTSLISGLAVRGGASSGRMRRGLIVAQVALSFVLLSSGGLVVRSFQRLLAADPGFRSEGVLTFALDLDDSLFPKDSDSYEFLNRVDAALRALPGVTAVSATSKLPLTGGGSAGVIEIPNAPGNTGDSERDRRLVINLFTRGQYVEAMGMRLLAGRGFEVPYREGVREALIDRYLAKQFFPDSSPIGATIRFYDKPVTMTIVGVVEQARLQHLHEDDHNSQLFVRAEDYSARPEFYVLRTDRDPHALIPEARAAIRRIDRRVAVSEVRTMDEIVAAARSRERISAVLIAGLALGALLLVAMGLFGMISGSVARRRGELAVRMALGATHHRVIRLVVGEGARLIVLGSLIGIPGIYISGQALEGFLVGVSPFDGSTLTAVAIGLIAVATLACYLAARRVTAIEPDRLLRDGG